MKRFSALMVVAYLCFLTSCTAPQQTPMIMATTKPVYDFTNSLCEGTGISVGQLITENVSCLHDYSLNVRQVRSAEAAEVIVLSGAGLEAFMEDLPQKSNVVIDSSNRVPLLQCTQEHDHEHDHHEVDAHIWLAPQNAKIMVQNIASGLCEVYPEHMQTFQNNLKILEDKLDRLKQLGQETLKDVSCRKLITFHDGFHYLAEAFQLEILAAMEEESGSEASAKELIKIMELVKEYEIPAVFAEENGSVSAADIISKEMDIPVYMLSMAMSDGDYFAHMEKNILALKEALG